MLQGGGGKCPSMLFRGGGGGRYLPFNNCQERETDVHPYLSGRLMSIYDNFYREAYVLQLERLSCNDLTFPA